MKIRGLFLRILIFWGIFIFLKAGNLSAQEVGQTGFLKVFIDCSDCDMDHLKQKITFIDYVNDRKDADLHILSTSRASGGGQEYQLQFIGLGKNVGQNHTLTFTSSSTNTTEELRQRFIDNLVFGLLPYIAETKAAEQIKVIYPEIDRTVLGAIDPWNYWVFNISASGSVGGEEKNNSSSGYSSVSAGRVTENWKIYLGTSANFQRSKYILSDDLIVISSRKSHSATVYAIKSMGEHWGVGSSATLEKSEYYNMEQSYKVALAGEYNFFPYDQSSDRNFTLTYMAGFADINYKELTIFGKINEKIFIQGVDINFTKKSQWGDSSISGQYAHLGNPHTMRLYLGGDMSWRITRGLSLDLSGRTQLIRDQIYLSGTDLTSEEILLKQRAQATGFDYYLRIGFSFRFGSIYNSIVNSRLFRTSFGIF